MATHERNRTKLQGFEPADQCELGPDHLSGNDFRGPWGRGLGRVALTLAFERHTAPNPAPRALFLLLTRARIPDSQMLKSVWARAGL